MTIWVQFYIGSWPERSSVTAGKQAHAIGHYWLSNNRERDRDRASRRQKEKWNDIGGPRAYSLPLGRADMPSNPSWLETVTAAGHTKHTSLFITYNTHARVMTSCRRLQGGRRRLTITLRRIALLWILRNTPIWNTMGLVQGRRMEGIANKSFRNPFICIELNAAFLRMYDLHRNEFSDDFK